MYRRSRKGCNVNVIHRITSETIRLSKMDLKPDNKPKNSEISSLQQSRKNPSGSFQITSVCLTGRFDTGEDSADDLDESRTDDISRIDNETPSCSEDTSFSRDGDDCYISSPNKSVPFTSSSAQTTTTTSTSSASTMYTTLATSPASTSIGRTVGERFKVVKMESVTPFTRGRWKCLDYVDHSKHTPPDGWVFCNDKYVKLSEVQAAYKAQATPAATSANPPSGTDSVVSTFTSQAVGSTESANYTDPSTSYQRQFSAPAAVTNYSPSAYPNQPLYYGNPPLMQWQYAPQMWIPPLLNMQPTMPLQLMNYQPPQTVTPVQQYVEGPVQPQQAYVTPPPQQYVPQHNIQDGNHQQGAAVLLQQSTQQQSILLFMNQGETGMQVQDGQLIEEVFLPQKVKMIVDETLRTSSMPPTPTTTPVEFGEKLQKRKTSSPGIEETSYGPIVKVIAATDITVKQGFSGATFEFERPIAVGIIEPPSPRDEKIGVAAEPTLYLCEIDVKEEFDGSTLELEQPVKIEVAKPVASSPRDASRTLEYTESSSRITDDSASGASPEAIDSKIEQAMDLVKDHLLYTIRGEVDILKERIAELMDRINQLEIENNFLRENASPDVLCALKNGAAMPKGAAGAK